MSNLTLDGSTSFIGTEFIKLLATGSSNLATEEYVDDAIEQNGGGNGNVDLSNYYTQTETDNLLNNKLNVINPQDIIGTLRIDSTNGNGKLIVNAVGAPNDEDFYVNGLSNLGGTLKAQLIQASSNIETSQLIRSDTINTYSNSNMIIQRNAIPYITLDSQEVDSQTVEKIILMKDVEFSGGLSLNTLSVDTLNTVGLNDLVFNVDTLGEFLRFQISDNTVRVPNTKSFLSQNIFSDIIKPIALANNISFQGKNTTSDGYEEYFKINSTDETVDFNKEINANENIVMLPNKFLYFDETSKVRYIRSSARSSPSVQNHLDIINEDGSQGRIRLLIGSNGSNTTDEQFLVDNTIISCKRNLRAGAGLESNTVNSVGDNNLLLQRNGSTLITLNSSNQIQLSGDLSLPTSNTQYIRFPNCNIRQGVATVVYFDFNVDTATGQYRFFIDGNTILNLTSLTTTISNELHLSNALYIDIADKLTLKPSLESGVNIFDIRNLHPVADNPMIRFRVGEGGGDTIVCEMTNNAVSLQRNVIVGTAYELRTNAIDTTTDNDLVFNRNNVPFLTLDKFTEDTVEKEAIICSKQLRANSNILVNNLQINQFSSGVQYADFRLHNIDSVMRFYVGNSTSANFQITNAGITLSRETTVGSLKTNTIDTNTDTDLLIKRSGTDVLNIFTYSPTNGPSIIVDAQSDCGISSSWLFANTFANRTGDTDTEFRGAVSGGLSSGKVYMTYKHATETLDFDCSIDNTGRSVIGNILDTTVSDERLKTDIEDVDTDFTSCIKNVKVKTFKYKDDKYKTNDNYGFIAQELKEHLPKECKNIVKENKDKTSDETFLSINYMKLSVVLWKCCQEQQSKIEHLEASMYEMMEDIKELKGKKTTKPKAKAKPKTKSKN